MAAVVHLFLTHTHIKQTKKRTTKKRKCGNAKCTILLEGKIILVTKTVLVNKFLVNR